MKAQVNEQSCSRLGGNFADTHLIFATLSHARLEHEPNEKPAHARGVSSARFCEWIAANPYLETAVMLLSTCRPGQVRLRLYYYVVVQYK